MDNKFDTLPYEGIEILRTTETGVKINWKAPKWRIIWAYIKYLYFKMMGRV